MKIIKNNIKTKYFIFRYNCLKDIFIYLFFVCYILNIFLHFFKVNRLQQSLSCLF